MENKQHAIEQEYERSCVARSLGNKSCVRGLRRGERHLRSTRPVAIPAWACTTQEIGMLSGFNFSVLKSFARDITVDIVGSQVWLGLTSG